MNRFPALRAVVEVGKMLIQTDFAAKLPTLAGKLMWFFSHTMADQAGEVLIRFLY